MVDRRQGKLNLSAARWFLSAARSPACQVGRIDMAPKCRFAIIRIVCPELDRMELAGLREVIPSGIDLTIHAHPDRELGVQVATVRTKPVFVDGFERKAPLWSWTVTLPEKPVARFDRLRCDCGVWILSIDGKDQDLDLLVALGQAGVIGWPPNPCERSTHAVGSAAI